MGRVLEFPQPALGRRGNLLTVTPARVLVDPRFSVQPIRASLDRIALESESIAGTARRLLSLAQSVLRRRSLAAARPQDFQRRGREGMMADDPQLVDRARALAVGQEHDARQMVARAGGAPDRTALIRRVLRSSGPGRAAPHAPPYLDHRPLDEVDADRGVA